MTGKVFKIIWTSLLLVEAQVQNLLLDPMLSFLLNHYIVVYYSKCKLPCVIEVSPSFKYRILYTYNIKYRTLCKMKKVYLNS